MRNCFLSLQIAYNFSGPHSNIEPLHHPPSSVSFPPTTLIIPNPSSSSSSLSSSLSSSVPHQPSSTPAIPLPILTSSSSSPAPSASTITLPTVPLPVVVQQQPQQQHQSPAASVPASIVVTTHSNNNNSISCLPQPPPLTLTMPSSILPSLPPASVLNGTLQLPLTTQPLLNDVTKLNLLPTEPVGSNSGSGGVKLLSPPSSLTNGVGGAKQSGAAVVGGTSAAVAPPIPTPQRTPLSEETRKALRRQRNKEAAARCRKRRLDQTETLQEEVDRWEALKAETQAEIRSLEDKQRELQELLRAHLSECKVAVRKTISEGEGVS